jgi:hypothetical protein
MNRTWSVYIAFPEPGMSARTFLSVLNQLNSDTLSNSRIRLFGFNSNFLEHDTLSVRRSTSWRTSVGGSKSSLLVVVIGLFNHSIVSLGVGSVIIFEVSILSRAELVAYSNVLADDD